MWEKASIHSSYSKKKEHEEAEEKVIGAKIENYQRWGHSAFLSLCSVLT